MLENKKFFTLEGGEGTGKSTVSKILKSMLEREGYNVILTREPGGYGVPFSEDIRNIIMRYGDISLLSELLLFAAARSEHMTKTIIPALKRGDIVLCDRFEDSTLVYQGIVKGLDTEVVNTVNRVSSIKLSPNKVFILDLSPEEAEKRISSNNRETNRFDLESYDFHHKVRDGFKSLVMDQPDKYLEIDAKRDPVVSADEIFKIILKELKGN